MNPAFPSHHRYILAFFSFVPYDTYLFLHFLSQLGSIHPFPLLLPQLFWFMEHTRWKHGVVFFLS